MNEVINVIYKKEENENPYVVKITEMSLTSKIKNYHKKEKL